MFTQMYPLDMVRATGIRLPGANAALLRVPSATRTVVALMEDPDGSAFAMEVTPDLLSAVEQVVAAGAADGRSVKFYDVQKHHDEDLHGSRVAGGHAHELIIAVEKAAGRYPS